MASSTLTDHLMTTQERSLDSKVASVDMKLVASVILGGGEGTRLYPLTLTRCKPAINFGGKYRLIDVPISLSIHANCQKIFVLTQFLSSSLHHHIFQTYLQRGPNASPIEILTAEQKPTQKVWFQGTADAVRQNIDYLLESPVEYFLILSGDQLYDIDFREMVSFAQETDADLVIATLPVTAYEASRMGILKVNERQWITDFCEKPQEKQQLKELRTSKKLLESKGFKDSLKRCCLASMGIYLFKRKVLADLLREDSREDFGKHLIPSQVQNGRVAAFLYHGYWEDIGTIETFYQANIALTQPQPPFSFHNEERPIFTCRYDLPPAKFSHTTFKQAILCEGAMIEAAEICHSLLGPRSVIHRGTIIRHSYLMGNDYYECSRPDHQHPPSTPHIGENCELTHTIVDKNVTIGNGVKLLNKKKLKNYDGEQIFIRDGIIIVPRGTILPDGFTL